MGQIWSAVIVTGPKNSIQYVCDHIMQPYQNASTFYRWASRKNEKWFDQTLEAGVPRLRLRTRVRDLGTRLAPWPSPEFGFGHSLYIRKSVKFRDMQPTINHCHCNSTSSKTKISRWGQFETTALPCNGSWVHHVPEMLRLSAEDRGWDLLAQILYNKICGATLLWQLKHGAVSILVSWL